MSNGDEIRQLYRDWLYNQINPERETGTEIKHYREVCEHMDRVVFDFSVPNDDNRAADAKELRYEFLQEVTIHSDYEVDFVRPDASLFEVIVSICRRLDFLAERGVNRWFRVLLENLGLDGCHDEAITPRETERIDQILHRLNSRRYKANGRGGLFPLSKSVPDQREMELWNQMNAYVLENVVY